MTDTPQMTEYNARWPALCRDCGATDINDKRCSHCFGHRIIRHPELFSLSVAHVDCDAFYAAVEKRDNPSLHDKPVIVGGGKRGVVSTACYVARISGVRSAMPMFKALKACPEAVVVKPNMDKYVAVSREIRALMYSLTPLVEPLSIDEAFLDLSGTQRIHGRPPAASLAMFATTVEHEIGISVSIGLAPNKFLAKFASDLDKPKGFFVIGDAEAPSFLATHPVSRIWGVGKAMESRLRRDGIARIGDLQSIDHDTLIRRYGSIGGRLSRLSNGEDTRLVSTEHKAKSVSSETTFNDDIADFGTLNGHLWRLCEKVSRRLKRRATFGRTVTLKLKTADFRIRTRSQTLDAPTQIADRVHRTARQLLERETNGTAFRLIGVGLSDLDHEGGDEMGDLFDPQAGRRADVERAVDRVREKFGNDSVQKGLGFKAARAVVDTEGAADDDSLAD